MQGFKFINIIKYGSNSIIWAIRGSKIIRLFGIVVYFSIVLFSDWTCEYNLSIYFMCMV